MILTGDIGGTKVRLAFFEVAGERLMLEVEETFPSRNYAGLQDILREFLSKRPLSAERACFGVAGPVRRGRCEATNLPWVVDAQQLAGQLGLKHVALLNDLEAVAYSVGVLRPEDFVILSSGAADAEGNAAVMAAGTGLGEAGLYWDGRQYHPFATEGGHADFAPRNELEMGLLRYMLGRFERVSWERVVSGPGLCNIYAFLRDTGRGEEPAWLRDELRGPDPAATIASAALDGRCSLCAQALDLFVSLYGTEAGNLALKVMATGGVFIGGGIAPKTIEKLKDGRFLESFAAKGRLRPLLESMPVRVIMNDRAALLGAAHYAATRASQR